MGITMPPKKPVAPASRQVDEAALARIVAAAPDATAAEKKAAPAHGRKMAGNQVQISFALPVELLDKVDEAASALSISRAAFIKQALARAVQAEVH